MKTIAVLCLVGIALTGCSPAQKADKEIRAAYAEMDKAMTAKDVSKAMSFMAPDAVVMDKNNKPMDVSKMVSGLQMVMGATSSVQSTTTVTRVTPEGKGAVAETSSKVSMTNPSGTLATSNTSRDYWEPVDGVWKIKRSRSLSESVTLNGKPIPTR